MVCYVVVIITCCNHEKSITLKITDYLNIPSQDVSRWDINTLVEIRVHNALQMLGTVLLMVVGGGDQVVTSAATPSPRRVASRPAIAETSSHTARNCTSGPSARGPA